MTVGEIFVWTIDLGMLAWLIRQGEILLKNDREKLKLEREQHRMAKERYEERAKWRQDKQKAKIKSLENAESGSGKITDGQMNNTTLSLPPKAESVQSVPNPQKSGE